MCSVARGQLLQLGAGFYVPQPHRQVPAARQGFVPSGRRGHALPGGVALQAPHQFAGGRFPEGESVSPRTE